VTDPFGVTQNRDSLALLLHLSNHFGGAARNDEVDAVWKEKRD
jgi:hypothetical protein